MRGEDLDRTETRQFAMSKFRGRKRLDQAPLYKHSQRVAESATKLVDKYLRECNTFISPNDQQQIEEAWHVGWLHDVLEDSGATYDDVVCITNLTVANTVAALSFDPRLPAPRRLAEYVNRLAHADLFTKIVKLADLGDNLNDMMQLLRMDPKRIRLYLQNWPEELFRCLEAIDRIGDGPLRDEFLWCREVTVAFDRIYARPGTYREQLEIIREFPFNRPVGSAGRKPRRPK